MDDAAVTTDAAVRDSPDGGCNGGIWLRLRDGKLRLRMQLRQIAVNPSGTDDVYGRPSDRGHMTCSDASVPVFCARFLPPPPEAEGKASEGGRPRDRRNETQT